MRYVGGKAKLARFILPVVLKGRKEGQLFVEPFCGGCNITTRVTGPRLANDSNPYVVAMFKALRDGWVPPDYVSFNDYEKIRKSPAKYPASLVGFVGFACAFAGKFLGTYARNDKGYSRRSTVRNVTTANYAKNVKRVLLKDSTLLEGVRFANVDYRLLDVPKGSIVYCDPPYVGTIDYNQAGHFDSVEFWAWVRNLSMYCKVYVSEYVAPKDFKSVLTMKRSENFDSNRKGGATKVEKLFVWKHGLAK